MFPGIVRRAGEAGRPLRLVGVAKLRARRRDEAVVEHAMWRSGGASSLNWIQPTKVWSAVHDEVSFLAISSPSAVANLPCLLNLIRVPTIEDDATSSRYFAVGSGCRDGNGRQVLAAVAIAVLCGSGTIAPCCRLSRS